MKKSFIVIFLILSLISCSRTFVKTGAISDQNRMNMSSLQVGMNHDQVVDAMGYPYKTEEKSYFGMQYEVWYYITQPTILGQTQLVTRNFTPLVFEGGLLKGWGRNFYKYTFDVDNEKWKRQLEEKQKYTNDKEEWPKNQHAMIPPMNEPKEESSDQQVDEIDKTILEFEKPDTQDATEDQQKVDQIQSQKSSQILPKNDSKNQKPLTTKKPVKTSIKKTKPLKKQPQPKTKPDTENNETQKAKDQRCKPTDETYIFWE